MYTSLSFGVSLFFIQATGKIIQIIFYSKLTCRLTRFSCCCHSQSPIYLTSSHSCLVGVWTTNLTSARSFTCSSNDDQRLVSASTFCSVFRQTAQNSASAQYFLYTTVFTTKSQMEGKSNARVVVICNCSKHFLNFRSAVFKPTSQARVRYI